MEDAASYALNKMRPIIERCLHYDLSSLNGYNWLYDLCTRVARYAVYGLESDKMHPSQGHTYADDEF